MKNNKLKTILTFFLVSVCVSLFAQGPQRNGQGGRGQGQNDRQQRGEKPDASEILSKLDVNNDEVIDRDEASNDRRGKIAEHFDEIDVNSDEVINLEELEESLNNRRRPREISPENIIKKIDDNNDGSLNELEVAAKKRRELIDNFNDIDVNQDNELDLEELTVFYTKNKKPKRQRRD